MDQTSLCGIDQSFCDARLPVAVVLVLQRVEEFGLGAALDQLAQLDLRARDHLHTKTDCPNNGHSGGYLPLHHRETSRALLHAATWGMVCLVDAPFHP